MWYNIVNICEIIHNHWHFDDYNCCTFWSRRKSKNGAFMHIDTKLDLKFLNYTNQIQCNAIPTMQCFQWHILHRLLLVIKHTLIKNSSKAFIGMFHHMTICTKYPIGRSHCLVALLPFFPMAVPT